jgi:hypothetical protein
MTDQAADLIVVARAIRPCEKSLGALTTIYGHYRD